MNSGRQVAIKNGCERRWFVIGGIFFVVKWLYFYELVKLTSIQEKRR